MAAASGAERDGFRGCSVSLADNLARVRERLEKAAALAGRRATDVHLVAVTKGCGVEMVRALWELGLCDFGESRVQEALPKLAAAPPEVRWHLIGHLQENKINKILPWVHLLQSLDSLPLARALDLRAQRLGRRLPVLLEVKTSVEPSKHGFAPEAIPEAYATVAALPGLEPQGLMTMAPWSGDNDAVRRSFAQARRLFEALPPPAPRLLSMGMSDDLEIAVEEGATMVRVGRALVGA